MSSISTDFKSESLIPSAGASLVVAQRQIGQNVQRLVLVVIELVLRLAVAIRQGATDRYSERKIRRLLPAEGHRRLPD